MKIETLVNLTRGELLNSPYISEVTSFTKNADEVERGSCFFAKNGKDIEEAVKRGAYAVVSEKYETVTDNEIAWIKINSFTEAVTDIFKYESLQSTVYYCDEITLEIINKMNHSGGAVFLNSDDDLLHCLNSGNKIILTSKKRYTELFSNIEILLPKEIDITMNTLFISNYNLHEIKLPFVYKDEFSRAVKFFEDTGLKFSYDFEIDRFKPVFVDFDFKEVEYGSSEKVLITGIKNDRFFFKELNYLIENTKYAKTVIVNEENRDILKNNFNFAMLVDFECDLNKHDSSRSLFD